AAGRLLPEVLRGGQAVGQALPSRGRRLPLRRGRPRRASALHGPRGVPKAQQAHPGGAERPADGRRGRRAGGSKGPRRPGLGLRVARPGQTPGARHRPGNLLPAALGEPADRMRSSDPGLAPRSEKRRFVEPRGSGSEIRFFPLAHQMPTH
ncbi:unnamed protein product, partial [Effrenium voratum]